MIGKKNFAKLKAGDLVMFISSGYDIVRLETFYEDRFGNGLPCWLGRNVDNASHTRAVVLGFNAHQCKLITSMADGDAWVRNKWERDRLYSQARRSQDAL